MQYLKISRPAVLCQSDLKVTLILYNPYHGDRFSNKEESYRETAQGRRRL